MYQAIQTKFLGPTNTLGARVKETTESGFTVTVDWDHARCVEENHAAAAEALARKLEWNGQWIGGALPGSGYAFVSDRGWDEMPDKFII